jgi:hypothetical protein
MMMMMMLQTRWEKSAKRKNNMQYPEPPRPEDKTLSHKTDSARSTIRGPTLVFGQLGTIPWLWPLPPQLRIW